MSRSQNDAILAHLRTGRSITPLFALEEFGCFRLGARIFELKQAGIVIESLRETDKSTGKTYAKYVLGSR